MKALRWLRDRLKDLFYGANNEHLDVGRVISFCSMCSLIGSVVWNMHLHQPIDLDKLGIGLSAILTALVVYVFKDRKENASKP